MSQFADDLDRQWRRTRPDAVHAHFWMSGLAATEAGERLGIPVALTYHALGIEKRRHQGAADTSPPGRLEIEAWLARAVDRVIATTAEEFRTLVDLGGDPARLNVVPCGVDTGLFQPKGPVSERLGARHRIVCVSRLVPRKGLAEVVEAIADLDDVELVIAGGPPAAMLADDAHAVELLELAERLGASGRVHLIGAVERGDVPALLRSADMVCCTPWYEPFGMVAVEAMACGVPVVASKVGGLAETVLDGTTGLLVPPRRPASIRAAVRSLLDQPARRRAMSTAAVRRAMQYSWDAVAARTLAIVRTMAEHGRTPAPPPPPEATRARAGATVLSDEARR